MGEGETESSLPFFSDERDWRMTVLRSLELTEFNPEYFSDAEQNWLVDVGILNEDRNDFNFDYLVKIGQGLYQAMFPAGSKVRKLLQAALRSVERNNDNRQLHIRLAFEADVVQRSRLADYPWELLHDGQRFLLHQQVNISRYIADEKVPPNLPPADKLNVLLVSSAAFDLELNLNQLLRREKKVIRKGLEVARDQGDIFLDQLEEPTIPELRTYLTEHHGEKTPHVLHFDGHGLFGKRCPKCRAMNKGIRIEKCRKCQAQLPNAQGYLVFEDEDGGADYVSAEELGVLLRQTSFGKGTGVTVVVLSACQSAMTIEGDFVFNGTAQNLISQRVPAVVAMQYSVRVDAATQFAEQFYRSLGQKNSLSVALSQGRETMGVEENQWYRPVLYLRWKDNHGGQLFTSGTTPSKPASDYLVGILVDVSLSMKTSIQNRDDRVQSRIEGFRQSLHQVVDKAKSNQQENSEVNLFALGFGFGNPLSWLRGDFGERVRDLLRLPATSEPTTTISQLVDDWEQYEENIEEMVKSMGGDTPMRQALQAAETRLTAEINKNCYKENPILFILSDGLPTDDPDDEIPRLIKRVKDKGIIIVSCYITAQNLTKAKCLYGEPEESWDDAAKFMFNCASVPRKKTSPLYSYLRERNWEIQDNGRLFAQVNETEFLEEFLEVIISPLIQEDESSSS